MTNKTRDEDQAKRVGTDIVIRWSMVERGLVNHKQGNTQSLASTSTGRADYIIRQMVERIKKQNRHCCEHKYYMWAII